jgi:hypothetical protein
MGSPSGSDPGSGATPPSPTTPASGAIPSTGIMPPALPIALKVTFTLITPDGLREISFGLEKDTDGTSVAWTLTFVLFERADTTTAFSDPIVSLNVFVHSSLHANAETAAHSGLTPDQTAHATGPAADAAKAVQEGTMPLPVGNKIIQNSLK